MRLFRSQGLALVLGLSMAGGFAVLSLERPAWSQETTGGLLGTVKDQTGAVVPGAKVELAGPTLGKPKTVTSDASGYYRFTNVPPGTYTATVTANGFETAKRSNVLIAVGRQPSLDFSLVVGSVSQVVQVSSEAPLIDTTSVTTETSVDTEQILELPHGQSFQSVIQFAPSARSEPLMGNSTTSNGSGGSSPGSGSNGGNAGFSIGGGSDSENSYLVDGQETADVIGGYSHTNMPFEFIDQVQLKTSGVQAEDGGALGGVVNAVTKSGTNAWHGSIFAQYDNDAMHGSPSAYLRYDPAGALSTGSNGNATDIAYQLYQPKKDKTGNTFPGFTLGGPLYGEYFPAFLKDRLFGFVGFNPEFETQERPVVMSTGTANFSENTQTYYTFGRLDATITSKLRVYGKWLFEGQRQSGENLPYADSTTGLINSNSTNPALDYAHSLGYDEPSSTTNLGADYTLNDHIVLTTRFGYFFQNYHDFGYPLTGDTYLWETAGDPTVPAYNHLLNYDNAAYNQNYTLRNAEKHIQFDQDVAWTKSTKFGTHNFKFGYQLNRISDDIYQRYNQPMVQLYPTAADTYYVSGTSGVNNCIAAIGSGLATGDGTGGSYCTGTYGYATIQDYGSLGKATSYNHAFFAQDSWLMGKGVTVNYGIRVEREYVPGETTTGLPANPINFGWGDKLAPRIGAAWDVYHNGKLKLFGGYGVFNDMMKLNLAISSFGGQYWQSCTYLLNSTNYTTLAPTFDANYRYCSNADSSQGATFATAPSATDFPFIENLNWRGTEGVVPTLKPYRQHETELGVDYQLSPKMAFEARWDRRRLDHVIEDAALFNPDGSEDFLILNPGEDQNSTNSYCGSACPPNVHAARSYDGIELRLQKSQSNHWGGDLSYTYSSLRGNYSGLTSSDIADGGGGRNAPNNSRAFDESYFEYNAHGQSASGPLATDRPNTLKGYTYVSLPWGRFKKLSTDVGLFQIAYQGTAQSSWVDVGAGAGAWPVYPEGRGKWTDASEDPVTGIINVGNTYVKRTPWFLQSDLNLKQSYDLGEGKSITFDFTAANILNERAVTAYFTEVDSPETGNYIAPGGHPLRDGAAAYSAYEHAYDWKSLLVSQGVTVNSWYGQPYRFQQPRNLRLQVHINF